MLTLFCFPVDKAHAQATNINVNTTYSSGITDISDRVTILGNGSPNVTLTVQNLGTVLNLGSAVNNSLYTGYNAAGSGSRVVVTNGGRLNANGGVSTGYGRDGVSNNQVIVTGQGSVFEGQTTMFLSRYGFNNSILISNGGLLSANRISVGGNPLSAVAGPYSPKIEVTGPNSVLRTTDWFQVGRISAAQLTLGNGGTIDVGGVMSVAGNDPGGSGMLIGNGTVNAGSGLAFTNAGRLAPSGTAPLTINGNLSFNSGFFDWNLFANSTSNPGTDFTRPIVLNGDISGVSSSRLVVNLTNSAGAGAFWDTSRAWDLITTTSGNLSLGTRLGLSFTGNTNSISLTNFSLLSTNNALRLVYNAPPPVPTEFYWNTNAVGLWTDGSKWSANAVPGATNTAFINHDGTSTLSSAAPVGAVVIGSTNGSAGGNLTLTNGGTLTASNVTIASAAGSAGSLNFNGGTLVAPTITFGSGTGTVNFNQAGALSVTSVISGNGTVNQLGAGTTTLSGSNTYTGPTFIDAGTLAIGGSGVLGSGTYRAAITNNGVFLYESSASQTLTGTISGSGSLVQNGSGTLTINPANPSGANTFTGGTTVNGGTLVIIGNDQGNSVLGPGAVTVNAGATLLNGNVNPLGWDNSAVTPDVVINGGTWDGGNHWAGFRNLTLSNGTLLRTSQFWFKNQPGVITVLGDSFITGGSYSLRQANSTSLPFNDFNVASNSTLTVSAAMMNGGINSSSASGFIKTGAGTMILLNGTGNSYRGNTIISNGVLRAGVNNSLSRNSTITLVSGGVLDLNGTTNTIDSLQMLSGTHTQTNGSLTVARLNDETIRLAVDTGSTATYNLEGGVLRSGFSANLQVGWNGAGTFNQSGGTNSIGGYLVMGRMTGASGTYNLTSGLLEQRESAYNSIIGEIGTGTLNVSGTGVFSNASAVYIGLDGGLGTLALSNNARLVAPGLIFGANTGNKVIFDLAYNTNYTGSISGNGSLFKNGSSTLTMSSADLAYTGTTTISNGTLVLNGEHTGGGAYTVNSGGTLGGLGSTTSSVTVAAGGSITPGAGATEELIIGGLTLDGRLNIFLDSDSSSRLSVLGLATLNPGSSVSFSTGSSPLTESIYTFLTTTGSLSGTFSTNVIDVPTGYGVFYDANDGIAFLKDTNVSTAVTAIFEGENAVIGNGSTNFGVFIYNGSSTAAVTNFTATAGALTAGGPVSTNNVATNSGVELSGLSFTNPGTTFGTNTGNFQTVVNGATNTVDYEVVVYDHAKGSLPTNRVSLGAAIVGFSNALTGSLQINASNTANGFNAPLGADVTNSPTNTLDFTAARGIQGGTSGNLSLSLGTNQTAGLFSNNVTVTFFDDSDLSGATTLATSTNTATFVVTADIYDHASNQISGNTLGLRPVHQGFEGTLVSTNSINVTNASGFRVALGSENTYTNPFGLTVGTVNGLAAGATADIDATYDLAEVGTVVGRFTNNVEVRFFDDSTLDGASTNVGTATIEVVGYVYTGQGVWLGNGTDWASITNWQEPGGKPGLDGALSVNDTATFDTSGTSYTVDLAESASLRAITFSNSLAYTIGGSGLISLTAASEGPATLANLDGTHTISNNVRMGSALQVTNATGSQLTIAGVLSGFNGFTKSGPGTLTLAGANTYSGTTTLTGGTLQATANGAFSSQSGVVLNGGTIDIGDTTQVLPSLSIVTGTHDQTNGTLSVVAASSSDALRLASQSGETVIYNLSGGTLSTTNSNLQVGWLGDATFNQTGGVVDIDGYFVLGRFAGSAGTYDLSAGTATQSSADRNLIIGEEGTGSMTVGGSGVLTDAGTIQLGLGQGSGTLRITNNGVVDAQGINLGWRDVNRLVFDLDAVETNFAVPITGAGSVVKAGTGTVVFDQNNSYRGTTTISNGALAVNGLHSGTGAYTVENGGILAGTGQVSAAVTVQSGGTINPGVVGTDEELIVGSLTIESGGVLNVILGGGSTSHLLVKGDLNLGATSTVAFDVQSPLTASLYPFLDYSGTRTGVFDPASVVPGGYELIYDADDKVIFLLQSSGQYAVSPLFNGENAVITGGTLPFDVFVFNNATNSVTFTAASGLNTTGAVSPVTVASETSDNGSGLEWSGTTVGANQSGDFLVTFTPPTGPVQTTNVAVEVSVYDHASAQYVAGNTNLAFAPVHARNTNAIATTNSVSVANAGGFRVDLGVRVEDNTNSAVLIDDVGGLAAGDATDITGLLEPSLVDSPGRFTNNVQLVSYDDSDLNGASVALTTNNIIVTGYIYTGQGEWNTPGGGDWANINQWQVPGGTPGLDGEYSVNDTALFGANGNGTVTNNGSVQMLSITFSNTDSYTIGGNGTITLTAAGGEDAAITTLAGAHTIDNRLELGSGLVISNATGTLLTLTQPVDGPFGLTKEGAGTTTLSGTNTYVRGTTVNGGQLNIEKSFGMANVADNGIVINAGTVSLNTNNVFGFHTDAIKIPVTVNAGGTLQNGGAFYNTLGPVTLNGGSIVATAVEPSAGKYSFAFRENVEVTGTDTSTISGPGMALGADTADSTTFNVADGATLLVSGSLVDGPSGPDYSVSRPSSLIKDGLGEMIIASNSTYTGATIIEAGTLTTRSTNSLGSNAEVNLNGGTLALENGLTINSLVWDSAGYLGMKDAVLDDVFLNITGDLALIGGGPHRFDLTGDFVGNNPTKLMAAPNMSAFTPTEFDVLGGLPGDYILTISNNTLWIASDVLIVDGSQQASGTNSFGSARFVADSDPVLELPAGSSVTIRTNVVMSNNSTVNVAGGVFGVTSGNSITVQSGSTLGGAGAINGPVAVAGTYAPGTNAAGGALTQNGGLTFESGSAFLWTLYQNTNSGPGVNFSVPVALGDNSLSVSTSSQFLMFFDAPVSTNSPFWRASPEDPLNSWTVMTGTDLAQGENFSIAFAAGSQTNGFKLKNFFFSVTNDSLVLNWAPGLVVFPDDDEFDPGDNEYPWITYEPGGRLVIPDDVNVIIDDPVVMSNSSTTIVNGQFTSTVGSFTVMNGSTVGGIGRINGNLVNNGVVSPGNSPGTLSIGGNFTQTPSGSFLLEAGSLSVFDRLNVTGTANLAGNLTATGFGGHSLSVGDRYQFLTADGGISGTFDTITMPAGLRGSFLVSGVNINLGTLLIAPATYTSMALTPNQFNVAAALDNFIGVGGDRGTVSAALDTLTAAQYPAAFEQTLPNAYASLPNMAFNTANALNSGMFQRLWVIRINGKGFSAGGMNLAPMQAEMGGTDDMGAFAINPSKDTKWGTFVDGNGIFANGGDVSYLQNYRSQSGGVSTGASYAWNDNLSTGVYVGYQGLQAEYDNGRTIDHAVRFGVFGTYDLDDFYFNALVGGAYHGYTVNRNINFGGLNRTATGRPGAGEFNLALGTGYDFDIGDFSWGPFTTMQYTYLGVQGFTETGAGALNLDVDPYNASSLLYTLGAQAAYNWKISKDVIVTPTIFAGWQHEFLQNGYTINSSFNTGGPAAPFNYNTGTPARDSFYGGVGVTVGVGDRWRATATYSSFVGGQNQNSQNLYLGLGYKF